MGDDSMSNSYNEDIFSNYPEVMDAKMIAEILNIGYVKALKLVRYGGIKYIKIGNVYRIPKQSFINWIYSGEIKEIDLEDRA